MKHYVWLGFNPSLPNSNKNRKTAFHLPCIDDTSFTKYKEIENKLNNNLLNKISCASYTLVSSDESWESLIEENKYFSSIKTPTKNIDEFIDNLNNVKVNAIDIAKYILRIEKCTSLRLQKLLYLVYSEYLKKYNEKLFNEKFYKWEHGPVNKKVYDYFIKDENTNEIIASKEGNEEILFSDKNLDDSYLKVLLYSGKINLCSFIKRVIEKYKDIDTWNIVNILHRPNTAWSKTTNKNEIISDELIKNSIY